MTPNPVGASLGDGDVVAVTGAAGFIGSAVVRALLDRGSQVRCLVEPGRLSPNLDGLDVEIIAVDVRNERGVRAAMKGAHHCFHIAALYGFWPLDDSVFYEVNVEGSRTVVRAAWEAGCQRIIYTSTVATIGLGAAAAGRGATEDDVAHVDHLFGAYKQTKYVAEHEVLRLGAQGAPVVIVQPTFPVGPGDERPTPTGRVILDFLLGRMPGYVQTSFNVAHVDDLAQGHLLAAERGRLGSSYICGGENMAMDELLRELDRISGIRFRDRRVPGSLALAAGWLSTSVEGRLLRREPAVPFEGARMSTTTMRFDDGRAREELGYMSRPAPEALRAAVEWFVEGDYLPDAQAAAIARHLARAGA